MQVSTKGRYALRAMIDLSLHTDQGPVLRKDIAERQEISSHYIGQLFVTLRKAGFIGSVKGPGGGYVLAQDADKIRAGDIIRTVEGPIALVQCVGLDPENACHRMDGCVTYLLWKRLSKTIEEVLDSVTLKDLCDQARGVAEMKG
ncbi:MAG: RrF2 family transcriptional regulator [Anaerolineae bacterium]|nr:RrF2 family transcriptional regulator [Anaerolineae bacterium]